MFEARQSNREIRLPMTSLKKLPQNEIRVQIMNQTNYVLLKNTKLRISETLGKKTIIQKYSAEVAVSVIAVRIFIILPTIVG